MSERLFDLPEADAERVEARHAALSPRLRALIHAASDALVQHRPDIARGQLVAALAQAPDDPDVLRMAALVYAEEHDYAAARRHFELAMRAGNPDALLFRQFAGALEQAGNVDEASRLRRRAVEAVPDSALAWFDFGEHCFLHEDMHDAVAALERALELAPGYVPALLKLGSALVYVGQVDDGAAAYRRVLAMHPGFGAAWFSLANIKTLPFTESETSRMRDLLESGTVQDPDRMLIQFALAKGCEDAGAFAEAFTLLTDANARMRQNVAWSAAGFSAQVALAEQVFAAPHARTAVSDFGREVVFIVGLPRSGTTLTEQILASHSWVEGANELGDLARILTEESARRRTRYPDWVPQATPDDWQRLGQRYLDATARWRARKPMSTDKMPSNWLFIGAIRAMLPGARIVVCRRDPLENCWSCFKQYFFSGWDFSFSLADIAAYWTDFNRSVLHWAGRDPQHIREQSYEELVRHPEAEIRGLLDFCGLPFEDACVHFHQSARSVRTASAGQVRQPMRKVNALAPAYGALLDPLRRELGLTPFGDAAQTRGAT